MYLPSLTLILTSIFVVYILHSMYVLSTLFLTLKCTQQPCFTSYLSPKPQLQLLLFTSVQSKPTSSEVTNIATINNFNYNEELQRDFAITIPSKTRQNGTLVLHVILASDNGPLEWNHLQRDGPTVIQRVSLTDYVIPKAATFNLLGESETESIVPKKSSLTLKPISHFKPKVYISMLTDDISMSQADIPPELARLIRINKHYEFLPIIQNNFLKTRMTDLKEITKNTTKLTFTFHYSPISIGKLRLLLHVEHALKSLKQLGFSNKDVDEVKGIFSDTNVYLLCGTIFVGSIHILFDFLSFKNDVAFWRRKTSYAGLSMRTTLWRGFSQIIIFLYLIDENTSMLVLIPAGIGTLIELWKCKKILKLEITLSGVRIKPNAESDRVVKAENRTKEVDKEAMIYLSYLLYPLCIGGAVYSLIYQPHKSWYSWTLNSLVNGVYAFGFLFMLPQLFINYKLKSVAALPWRAFMYKAFNTFIDDIFAFIITMPTAHRLACFRDDIVFLIYLYQRWLYPVDKSRLDDGNTEELESTNQTVNSTSRKAPKENKKTK